MGRNPAAEDIFVSLLCFCLGILVDALMNGSTMCLRSRFCLTLASRRFLELVPPLAEFRNHSFLHHGRYSAQGNNSVELEH